MKKTFKTLTALLLLLTLITTVNPVITIPQPEDTEPGITVQNDDDGENDEDYILTH